MFHYPDDLDKRLGWKPGKAERLARQRRLPHLLLPDGSIRFDWNGSSVLPKTCFSIAVCVGVLRCVVLRCSFVRGVAGWVFGDTSRIPLWPNARAITASRRTAAVPRG